MSAAKTVTLTPAEREDVDWAFGAMMDYWGADCKADTVPGSYIEEPEGIVDNELTIPDGALMPFLDGNVLTLSTWDEINDDLISRIEDLLPDMAEDAAGEPDMSEQRAGQIAARCARLGEKIRQAMEA